MKTKRIKITEREARQLMQCPCCGAAKELGTVVCWDCFKHTPKHSAWDLPGFKYWTGSLEDYIAVSYCPF